MTTPYATVWVDCEQLHNYTYRHFARVFCGYWCKLGYYYNMVKERIEIKLPTKEYLDTFQTSLVIQERLMGVRVTWGYYIHKKEEC